MVPAYLWLLGVLPCLLAVNYNDQAAWNGTCSGAVTRQSPIDIPCEDFITTCPKHIKYQVHWDNPVTTLGGSTKEDMTTPSNKNLWVLFSNSTNDYLFKSAQFHIHRPSEHTINGKRYPLEMHIVHVLDSPSIVEYLVIGLLFEVDAALTYDFLDFAPINSNSTFSRIFPFAVTNKAAYHYLGSLTTPPCAEAVNWFLQT